MGTHTIVTKLIYLLLEINGSILLNPPRRRNVLVTNHIFRNYFLVRRTYMLVKMDI